MSFHSFLELDARLSDQLRVAEKPGFLRNISVVFAHSGDSWFWAAALILLWLFGDPAWKKWEVVELVGIAGLAGIVLAIKFMVRRRRPEGEWGGIYRSTDPHSFPSGHSARAFLIAIVASVLAPTAWLIVLLWIWAPLVGLARVAMGVHYVSDVLVGAILGILVALIGLEFYEPLLAWFFSIIGYALW
jgi:membrane-associated phospholipid phosphatase